MAKLSGPLFIARAKTQDLMSIYGDLYAPSRKGQLSVLGRMQFSRIKSALEKRLQVIEVTSEMENDDLHKQMAGFYEEGKHKGECKDQVHEFGMDNPDTLRKWRLGGKNTNKTAYALINPENREVLSVIYVSRSDKKVEEGMTINEKLNGNVFDILRDEVRELENPVTSLIFYSISRLWKMNGEGELLISKLHQHLTEEYKDRQEVIFSTLSPLRGLKEWFAYKSYDFKSLLQRDLPSLAFRYLTEDESNLPKGAKNLVKRFHLANGAEIIGIRTDANAIGSKDFEKGLGVMVHFGYPRDTHELSRNMHAFSNAGEVRVSEGLTNLYQPTDHSESWVVPDAASQDNVIRLKAS